MQRAAPRSKTAPKASVTTKRPKALSTITRKPQQKKSKFTQTSVSAFQSAPSITVPSNVAPSPFTTSTSNFSANTQKRSQHGLSGYFEEASAMASLFHHSPKQAIDIMTHTKLQVDHDAPMTPFRRMRHLLAQPAIFATAMLSKDENAPAPTALTPSDLPSTLPAPVLKKGPQHIDGVEITHAADGATVLDPVISDFVPPSPSRTIPIIHDGLEWDEPNFLFRPFVHAIDWLHDTTGLPWYATLISWAWLLRTSISPLTYKQQASMVRFTLLQPEMMRIRREMRGLDPKSNSFKQKQAETNELYKKHGVGPFTSVFWAMSSIPFYILSFMAIRNMSNSPYFAAEFATGGFMPYTNLSASAGWELAAVNAFVNLLVLHSSQAVPVHQMQKIQKIIFAFSHLLILGFIPVLSNINTASILYFIANNGFSIFFQKLFYSDWFRKMAGLPSKDEVNAVRQIVTDMSTNPDAGAGQVPQGVKSKDAYVLDSKTHTKVEKSAQDDILAQARSLIQKKEVEKKVFATGGASALESARLQQEQDKVKASGPFSSAQGNAMKNFVEGRPGDKNIYVPQATGPKPEKQKVVNRRGWKKH